MTITPQKTLSSIDSPHLSQTLLPQWGLILAQGEDAAGFLQNQLSNSVVGLQRTVAPQVARPPDSAKLLGYCTPQGRLMASAWIGLFPNDENAEPRFALFISKDIAASIAKRLSMFVLRSKVKVIDASANWTISGLYGSPDEISSFQSDKKQITLQLPDVLVGNQSYSRLLNATATDEGSLQSAAELTMFNYLEVLSAIPRIVLATQEQFVPQMINFESVAGVDFKKGCYPGQEIVARSQYRGAIKRRLQLAHCSSISLDLQLIEPGTELFHTSDPTQPAGMVVLSALNPSEANRIDFQIECKLEMLLDGEIHLGSIDGPVLKIDKLPYPFIEI